MERAEGSTASGRNGQALGFLLLSVLLSLFLMQHSALVELDYQACFENAAASINGDRLYSRAADLSFAGSLFFTGRPFLTADLLMAALGMLPLLPFAIAWFFSKTRQTRRFWFVSACVALAVIVTGTSMANLSDFHDCDRKGVSLAIAIAPILYMGVNMAVMSVLATLRYPFTL